MRGTTELLELRQSEAEPEGQPFPAVPVEASVHRQTLVRPEGLRTVLQEPLRP